MEGADERRERGYYEKGRKVMTPEPDDSQGFGRLRP